MPCDRCVLTMTAGFLTACHAMQTPCGSDKTCSLRKSSQTFPLHFPTVCGRIADYWTYLTHMSTIRGMDGSTRRATMYSGTPLIRTFFFIRIKSSSDLLGPSGKFVENSTKLTCLEITSYQIKYSTVLWLLQLQISRGRKVETQVHTVNSNSRTSNCKCGLFSKKCSIIRIFCISGWLAVPINPLASELFFFNFSTLCI